MREAGFDLCARTKIESQLLKCRCQDPTGVQYRSNNKGGRDLYLTDCKKIVNCSNKKHHNNTKTPAAQVGRAKGAARAEEVHHRHLS